MKTLTVAVSARALFDLEEANALFLEKGPEAFVAHMRETQDIPLAPGVAFPLIKGLLNLNTLSDRREPLIDVVMVTSFSNSAGIRILRSINHHQLPTLRSSFITGNKPTVEYLDALGVDLLLSKSPDDAQAAIRSGIAAAVMYDLPKSEDFDGDFQIRIAFDGDAVLFSDESERIYKARKLPGFLENEKVNANIPLADGPFAKVFRIINDLQQCLINGRKPFRIALVTARGGDARERVIRTFDSWGIDVDEAHYLSGWPKAGILKAFRPHIFFDDQDAHVGPASEVVPSGLVPWANPLEEDATVAVAEAAVH
ncbi:5'-nucleotidase [Rhizobium sp. BK176]|uniref:5'-nucleotidase n=1 Tax=Rhizobium sp. BK176 TaxID=2587071 RepID=UPI002167AE2F|nr:5'-nucleotidase [Rhizobium sp. BK176]MCS4089605.1 5'-nucleotidase [Rhizobium sp. BK176]